MPNTLHIQNCVLYNAPQGAFPVDVLVRDGRIVRIAPQGGMPTAHSVLDAAGRTLIPGLIDLHVHGAGGADVLDGTPEALRTFSRSLARLGTTSFLGTTFVDPHGGNRHLRVAAEHAEEDLGGACLLGIHLEGPFVNPERRGGLPPTALRPPSHSALDEVLALTNGQLRMMTIAPELGGNPDLIERLTSAGVIASFGHSDASYEQTRDGISAGISHATHLFNAMRGLHHREPGPLVAIHEAEHVAVQLISDDVHVNRHVVRWTQRVFGERVACITDAMRTAGLPDGRYRFGAKEFDSCTGAARYLDGTLIGTSLSLREVVFRFREYTGGSFAAAVDSASLVPARVLGIDDCKGSVTVGKDADLVLLDPDGSVWATLVGGVVVYRREADTAGPGRDEELR